MPIKHSGCGLEEITAQARRPSCMRPGSRVGRVLGLLPRVEQIALLRVVNTTVVLCPNAMWSRVRSRFRLRTSLELLFEVHATRARHIGYPLEYLASGLPD